MDTNTQVGEDSLIEQYKLYVEMADRVSARRVDVGKLYVSLVAALTAVIPLIVEQSSNSSGQKAILAILGVMGILLCIVWMVNIRSYKQLNSLKFRVIHEIEERLPFPMYQREWEILKDDKKNRYVRLSSIEQSIPLLFTIPFLLFLIFALQM